ncbi:MAG: hypothetical protein IOC42_05580 [Methylobacterium sp.]|nr:hypothetical protein [Methylobacterium sp.]MCA3703890.1 hypothetical protein [Methylobacterium sp.]
MPDMFGQGYPNPTTAILVPRAIFRNQSSRSTVGLFQLSNANVVNDTLFISKVPSNAIIKPSSTIVHDALGAGVTMNVGFNETPAGARTALGSALAVATAGTKAGMAAVTTANLLNRVWQLAGLAADPGREIELVATITGATVAGTPRIYFSFDFVDER